MTSESTIVEVSHVSKRFVIRTEKSLKERLVNFGRSNLHKRDFFALKDVNFDIEAGSTVGLIGPNGSGKSTLLKTIGGILRPSSGQVRRRGRMAALLELGAGFHPDLTGRENVYLNAAILGISKEETDMYFDDIVEFSGIPQFIDTQVKFYSSGMYVRLAFAVAVHVNPDLLIVDEVLAVGDELFQRKCLDYIRTFQQQGGTIVLVAHDLEQVAELCTRVLVLEHGKIVFDGDPHLGVKVLREDFRNAAKEDESLASSLEEVGVRIASGSIVHNAGQAQNAELSATSPFALEFSIDCREELEGLNFIVDVVNDSGQRMFSSSTQALGLTLEAKSGIQHLSFEFAGGQLGEGTYEVSARVESSEGAILARESGIETLNIHAPLLANSSKTFSARARLIK